MSINKQNFIEHAVEDIIGCAANYGLKAVYQEGLSEVIVKYLKQSFRNGAQAGRSIGSRKGRKGEAEGQHSAM